MRNNKNTSKIILAMIVAVLATMISYSAFNNMHNQLSEQQKIILDMQKAKSDEVNENYAYAVATGDLKAGEIVADTDVDFKQFGTQDASAFDNRSDVVNKVLLKDIKSGEVFTNLHIARISNDNVQLRDGYRALTLPSANFQGQSDSMIPGSFVDIYSSDGGNDWILENIKILSLESDKKSLVNNTNPLMSASTAVTFEVPADSISDFISNISKSRLVLVIRGVNDKKILHRKTKSTYSYNANYIPSLPKDLPSTVPISNYPNGNYSGLPQPIMPAVSQQSVEVIEANVKSKVTFD